MLDFFNIDSQLSEDERAVRDSVRHFVDDRVLPIIGKCYVDGRFPKELVPEMAELGVLGANLPEEYGCAGLNNVAYGLIMQELERGHSGVRSFASVQGALAMYPIFAFGSEDQRRTWLPKMARGEVIGCFGLTEPDFGSDPAGMRTTARRRGSDWVLNGTKLWITNGGIADVALIWARAESGVRGFIVPTDTKGFTARDIHRKLVEMLVEINKGTLLAHHLGRMKDEGRIAPQQVSVGKLNNVRAALEIAREARSILGANGITLEYPVIRHMNNLESVFTYEGTHEIHTLAIGEAITGLAAYR